jgi:hypothetical protein
MEFCYSGEYYILNSGEIMKEYVLKIGFDPNTDKVVYVKEYIEGAKATLHVGDDEIELDDEIAKHISFDTMGIT